jgi:MFS family permease
VRPPKNWRLRGWLQLLSGLILVGLMGTITYNLAPQMLRPGVAAGGGGFTGTAEQGLLILGLFGFLITFGLGSVASGLWQIATGRRNKWIFALTLGLFLLVMLAAWLTTGSLKG